MGRYWDLIAEYNATGATFTEAAGTPASPYHCLTNGRLKGIRAVVGRDAATSLIDHVVIKLSSPNFNPNAMQVGAQGSGLQTAPALQSGESSKLDWEVDQPVVANQQITVECRNATADTPVTPVVMIYGLFESGG